MITKLADQRKSLPKRCARENATNKSNAVSKPESRKDIRQALAINMSPSGADRPLEGGSIDAVLHNGDYGFSALKWPD